MSSQTPSGEPPPEPAPPEPDAETARVPVDPTQGAPETTPPQDRAADTPPAPSAGLISAQPTAYVR